MKNNFLALPGITLCSSISIKKSTLLESSNETTIKSEKKSKELQEKYDKYYHQYLDQYSMEDLIYETLDFNDIAYPEKTMCLVDIINKSNYCKKLQLAAINSSVNLQTCWTLFHDSQFNPLIHDKKLAPRLDLANRKVVIKNNTLIGPTSTIPFAPGEIIRFVVDLKVTIIYFTYFI